jgi:hypothetical protein
MDDAEAAEIVAMIAAFDPYQRFKVSNVIIDAWAVALADVDAGAAQRAVVRFYREVVDRPLAVGDVVRLSREIAAEDAAWRRHEQIEARRTADREAVQSAIEPAPRRDRRADIAALIARHRNWSPTGHLGTRRAQARWNPDLRGKYEEALIETARRENPDTPEAGVIGGDGVD